MEEHACVDRIALRGESGTALANHLFDIADGFEMDVYERLIDERPKVLGGLQLRAMAG